MAGQYTTARFLGLPYDWRSPTLERLESGMWYPGEDRRIFGPQGLQVWRMTSWSEGSGTICRW